MAATCLIIVLVGRGVGIAIAIAIAIVIAIENLNQFAIDDMKLSSIHDRRGRVMSVKVVTVVIVMTVFLGSEAAANFRGMVEDEVTDKGCYRNATAAGRRTTRRTRAIGMAAVRVHVIDFLVHLDAG